MPTFSFFVSGEIILEADNYEDATEALEMHMDETFMEWQLEAAYGNEGEFLA